MYSEAIEFFFWRIFLCVCVYTCMHAWVGNDLIILASLPPFALLSIAIYIHLIAIYKNEVIPRLPLDLVYNQVTV